MHIYRSEASDVTEKVHNYISTEINFHHSSKAGVAESTSHEVAPSVLLKERSNGFSGRKNGSFDHQNEKLQQPCPY